MTDDAYQLLLSFDHELSDDEIEELRVNSSAIGIFKRPGILDATLRVTTLGDV